LPALHALPALHVLHALHALSLAVLAPRASCVLAKSNGTLVAVATYFSFRKEKNLK